MFREPKYLLQQHCQKCGWPAPRFERLQGQGGGGMGYRCAVRVERTSAGKKKKGGGGGVGDTGLLQLQLDDRDDGFVNLQVGAEVKFCTAFSDVQQRRSLMPPDACATCRGTWSMNDSERTGKLA